MREYRTFNELRRDMRGSASWSNHIDEIAEHTGKGVEHDDQKHNLFDSAEDFDDDDKD
jgi:hypothetical protein